MAGALQWPLLTGWVPAMLLVGAGVAGSYLLLRRRRQWWTRVVPWVAFGSVLASLVVAQIVDGWWRPFPDPLPLEVKLWVGAVFAAVGLGVGHVASTSWGKRTVGVIAVLVVTAAGLNQINRYFGYYPTGAAVLGLPLPQERPLPGLQPSPGKTRANPMTGPLVDHWKPPVELPATGAVSKVIIPGTVSGFRTRPGWVYLPPAYLTHHRPDLPVMVLIIGQPGNPRDWIDGGNAVKTLDAFAGRHHGLAPIVVMPDPLGRTMANPLCADSSLGRADTYLAGDVPAWIGANLQVNPDRRSWSVGGFSFGGTCSLQLAVNHPALFSTFLDISGQVEPTLGSRRRTVDRAFHGDEQAFIRINPVDVLAPGGHPFPPLSRSRFVGLAGVLAVGASDRVYGAEQDRVRSACAAAGVPVRWMQVPGRHSWQVASMALEKALPWLATRMGLTG